MPTVQLNCKHLFHVECLTTRLRKRWTSPRIIFNFLECPECKERLKAAHCPPILKEFEICTEIESLVYSRAIQRAKIEGLDKHERLSIPGDRFYNDLKAYAIFKLAYY